MVVVPRDHDVSLHFARSSSEKIGAAGSVVGLVGLVALGISDLRRRRRTRPTEETPSITAF
jgi:hypothetical protein